MYFKSVVHLLVFPLLHNNRPTCVVYIATAAAIYSLGHRLHISTAMPESTQPYTVCGTVKCVSAYGLSDNDNSDGGCGW